MSQTQQKAAVSGHSEIGFAMTEAIITDVMSIEDPTKRPVPMIYGRAGIGKTTLARRVARKLGFEKVIVIRAAELRPEDLTGPPMPYQEGFSRFHPPEQLLVLTKEWHAQKRAEHEAAVKAGTAEGEYKEPGRVMILFDELPNAHPDVQATLHSLILDREFGVQGYHLLDQVYMLATGNRREDGAHTYEFSAPMRTRLAPHIVMAPTLEEWGQWAREADIFEPIRVFISQREGVLHDFNPKSKNLTYANQRTWEMASNLCKAIKDETHLGYALEGTVGPGPAAEFMVFLRTARKAPTAEDIAKNPEGIDTFDNEPDIALVAVENMISAARRKPEWVKAFIAYGKRMHEQYRELLFPELLNLNNTMPPEVIMEVFTSKDFAAVRKTSENIGRIIGEGDAASKARQGNLGL